MTGILFLYGGLVWIVLSTVICAAVEVLLWQKKRTFRKTAVQREEEAAHR